MADPEQNRPRIEISGETDTADLISYLGATAAELARRGIGKLARDIVDTVVGGEEDVPTAVADSEQAAADLSQIEPNEEKIVDNEGARLKERLGDAYEGYAATVEAFNAQLGQDEQIELVKPEALEAAFNEWYAPAIGKYISKQEGEGGGVYFDVVAYPAVNLDSSVLCDTVEHPGPHWEEGMAAREAYAQYTAAELSLGVEIVPGEEQEIEQEWPKKVTNTGPIEFALVPNRPTPNMSGNVQEQGRALVDLQLKNPEVDLGVLPVSAVLAWWNTTGNRDKVSLEAATKTRHFDLPERMSGSRFSRRHEVPVTYVTDEGSPTFAVENSKDRQPARISVLGRREVLRYPEGA